MMSNYEDLSYYLRWSYCERTLLHMLPNSQYFLIKAWFCICNIWWIVTKITVDLSNMNPNFIFVIVVNIWIAIKLNKDINAFYIVKLIRCLNNHHCCLFVSERREADLHHYDIKLAYISRSFEYIVISRWVNTCHHYSLMHRWRLMEWTA